jgi:hypothetical protein
VRHGNNSGFLFGDDGVIALNLGSDYCAEHEWGIKGIRRDFGMKDDGYGVERRRIRQLPQTSRHFGQTWGWKELPSYKAAGFWLTHYRLDGEPRLEYGFYRDQTLWTGWSGEDLGAFSNEAKGQKRLRELFDAIERLDACIWLGGGGVFENAGLVIGITSRLPKDVLVAWDKNDREHEKLMADAKATGIADRLKAAGKEYYALSPHREKDGSIVFFLNPQQQRENNCGWFTVKDLDAWIRGNGPIPKKKEARP